MRKYLDKSVYDAAKERIAFIFDEFENVIVSTSSGKDSTCVYNLCLEEAVRRNRKLGVFFLDQEAEYEHTVILMRKMMNHPNVIPYWFQVPVYMTNATSYIDDLLFAWGEGEEWIRPKEDIAIKAINEDYPKRFYGFFNYLEKKMNNTAFVLGLRADESLNRYRAVTRNAGYKGKNWSTKTKNKTTFRFNPIYDWGVGDVWKYISDNNIEYNRVYDLMYMNNHGIYNTMRVSNLVHEKSFKCLSDLQKLEPQTYAKLIDRIGGIDVAARYAEREYLYNVDELPKSFKNWKEYRDYLLKTAPISDDKKERMIKRFNKHPQEEEIFKQHCKQVLINDWENNIPININKPNKKKEIIEKWWDVL